MALYGCKELKQMLLSSRNFKHKSKQHFCMNCLQGFNTEKTRDEHYVYAQ